MMFFHGQFGLRVCCFVALTFAFIADIGFAPGYNSPLVLFAFVASAMHSQFFYSLLIILWPLTLLLDIIWLAIYGSSASGNDMLTLSVVFTILLLFVRIPLIYFSAGCMIDSGGFNVMILPSKASFDKNHNPDSSDRSAFSDNPTSLREPLAAAEQNETPHA